MVAPGTLTGTITSRMMIESFSTRSVPVTTFFVLQLAVISTAAMIAILLI